MPNSFYNTTSFPATGSAATSASMRAELARIAAGFDKLPALASNANKIVVVNLGATGLDVLAAPAGDLVGTSSTQTLTGKSISMASNTLTGTLAQFNTALTDADFATLAGVETLTNKTISGGSINGAPIGAGSASTGAFSSISVSGAASIGGNTTLSGGAANGVAYLNGSKVLTTGSALTFDGSGTMFLGVAGSANTTTLIYLNATDNAANGGAIVGRRGGANAWVLGDRSTIDGSGAGFVSYNYGGTAPWIWEYQTGSEQMRLTSTGLGLGVTPSAWGGNGKAFETSGGSFYGFTTVSVNIANNAYFDGTNWIYKNPGPASNFRAVGGGFDWNIAPSGTAGSPITFTQGMTLTAEGNLLVGTTSNPSLARFRVSNGGNDVVSAEQTSSGGYCYKSNAFSNGGTYYHMEFQEAGTARGSIISNGSTTLYNTTSDHRLKENIQDAAPASALIDSLQVREYDWKANGEHQRYGFIAQELVTVAPEAVHQPEDPEAMMAVDYSKLVPMLVKEIQDLRKRLAAAGI